MFNYRFFDYTDFIPETEKNSMFSSAHIIYIVLATLALFVLCYFLRNMKKKHIEIYLKVLSVIMIILEIVKVSYETYWDVKCGHGFNLVRNLPFYTCSMFVIILPLAAWGKGKVKEYSLAFLVTLSVFAGLTNFFLPPVLNMYPVWSFSSMISLNYHFLMVFTGLLLMVTKYYMPSKESIFKGYMPLFLFSIIVIPIDYFLFLSEIAPNVDYMLYIHGNGAPFLPAISSFLGKYNLRFIFTLAMVGIYYVICAIFVGIYQMVFKLFNVKHESRFTVEERYEENNI